MKTSIGLAAIALACACAAATAQDADSFPMPEHDGVQDASGASGMQSEAGAELQQAPSSIARVQPKTQGDVTYLCGGVGSEEAGYIKQQAGGYDLMLTFATRNGSYLADVDVEIRDAKGNTVLSANCDAPMMLVDLPRSGNYRIHAEAAGYTLDRTARVTARHQGNAHVASVVMSWPQQVAEGPPTSATSSGGSGDASGTESSSGDGAR